MPVVRHRLGLDRDVTDRSRRNPVGDENQPLTRSGQAEEIESSRFFAASRPYEWIEALDHCALENWFFNIRREGRAGLTPVELQLQWRVSYHKDYLGSSALRERRASPAGRVTSVVSPKPLAIGAPVTYQGRLIGRLINAGFSESRSDWVGLALLDLPHAHAGLWGYLAEVDGREAPLRTVAPPLINNRSLFIDLQQHSWSTRQQDSFPPLSPLSEVE